MKFNWKKSLVLMLIFALVFTFAACGGSSEEPAPADEGEAAEEPAGETFNYTFCVETPDGSPLTQVWQEWCDKVREGTEGRVNFEFYTNNAIMDQNTAYQQIVTNVVTAGNCHHVSSDGFKIAEVWNTLTAGVPSEYASEVGNDLFNAFPEVSDEFKDVKVLACSWNGANEWQLMLRDKEVKSMDDLKGMTIWCLESYTDLVASWGATPVFFAFTDLYSSLEKGIVDGCLMGVEVLQSMNYYEVVKYVTRTDICSAEQAGHVMNLDAWNALSDADKEFIDSIAKETEDRNWELSMAAQDAALEFAQQNGVTVTILDDAEKAKFQDSAIQVAGELAKKLDEQGLPGTAIREKCNELIKQYAG